MFYAAIGGMQLNHWTGYFRIIRPTLKVLKQAKHAQGCVKAVTFKAGDVFFAVSIWESPEQMQDFAKSGLHARLTDVAMKHMALFYNHSLAFSEMPDRETCVSAWGSAMADRGGKGTVGTLRT